MGVPSRCCCIEACLYLLDRYAREDVNPELSDRYDFTEGDWVIVDGVLVCETADSPIYFKHSGVPQILKGSVQVNFWTADEIKLHVGSGVYTLTKDSATELSIDGVTFEVAAITEENPWLTFQWEIPVHLNYFHNFAEEEEEPELAEVCVKHYTEDMPYCLDPLNEAENAYQYDQHWIRIGIRGATIKADVSDEMKVTLGNEVSGPTEWYSTEIVIDEDSFTSYGFSGPVDLELDNLEVYYLKESANEIQTITFTSPDRATGTWTINGETITVPDDLGQVQTALDTIFGAGEVTASYDAGSDTYTIEWDGDDYKWRNRDPLELTSDFFDSEELPQSAILTTVQDGGLENNCCNTMYRPCHHACWPDALPDEIHLTIFGPSSVYHPCSEDLTAFEGCVDDCETMFPCESMPYSTELEKDARCQCFTDWSDCELACFGCEDPEDPECEPRVQCRETCPADWYASSYVLQRKSPPDTVHDYCVYELEVTNTTYWAITGGPDLNFLGVMECSETTTCTYIFRFRVSLNFFDCENHLISIGIEDESSPNLFNVPEYHANGDNEILCLGGCFIMTEPCYDSSKWVSNGCIGVECCEFPVFTDSLSTCDPEPDCLLEGGNAFYGHMGCRDPDDCLGGADCGYLDEYHCDDNLDQTVEATVCVPVP